MYLYCICKWPISEAFHIMVERYGATILWTRSVGILSISNAMWALAPKVLTFILLLDMLLEMFRR